MLMNGKDINLHTSQHKTFQNYYGQEIHFCSKKLSCKFFLEKSSATCPCGHCWEKELGMHLSLDFSGKPILLDHGIMYSK